MDCIFCKIVKGEIPSARVYEDSLSMHSTISSLWPRFMSL